MPVDTDQFRDLHRSQKKKTALLRRAARLLPELSPAERAAIRDRVLEYLHTVVDPHTLLDERLLYPEVASRLGGPLATAPMAYDHLAIRWWIDRIAEARLDRPERLQELLYGLDALIRVHLWKENELYLAVLDSPPGPAR